MLFRSYHLYDDVMLFDLASDPHQTNNLAEVESETCDRGLQLLGEWYAGMLPQAARGRDPLKNVIAEGGPFHVRGQLQSYLDRLRETGRGEPAAELERKYAGEFS